MVSFQRSSSFFAFWLCSDIFSYILILTLSLSLSLSGMFSLFHSLSLYFSLCHILCNFLISDTCGVHNWVKVFRSCYRKLAQVGFNHRILQLHWSIGPWVQLAFTQFWLCSDIFWFILTLTLFLTITISLSLSDPQTLSLSLSLSHSLSLFHFNSHCK